MLLFSVYISVQPDTTGLPVLMGTKAVAWSAMAMDTSLPPKPLVTTKQSELRCAIRTFLHKSLMTPSAVYRAQLKDPKSHQLVLIKTLEQLNIFMFLESGSRINRNITSHLHFVNTGLDTNVF